MQNSKRNLFTLALIGCLFLGLTLGCGSIKEMANSGKNASPAASPADTATPSSSNRSPSTTERPASKGGLTLAKFNRLEKGMTYAEVVEIIGAEGTKTGGLGDKETTGFAIEIYKWTESGSDAEITVVFKDSELDTKFTTAYN